MMLHPQMLGGMMMPGMMAQPAGAPGAAGGAGGGKGGKGSTPSASSQAQQAVRARAAGPNRACTRLPLAGPVPALPH